MYLKNQGKLDCLWYDPFNSKINGKTTPQSHSKGFENAKFSESFKVFNFSLKQSNFDYPSLSKVSQSFSLPILENTGLILASVVPTAKSCLMLFSVWIYGYIYSCLISTESHLWVITLMQACGYKPLPVGLPTGQFLLGATSQSSLQTL